MNLDELTLGQIKQLKSMLSTETTDSICEIKAEPVKSIVILQRGWVMVGDLVKNGPQCFLSNASVIRRWGTTNGLGELAEKGPLTETKLEPIPNGAEFHELTVVATLPCVVGKWPRS